MTADVNRFRPVGPTMDDILNAYAEVLNKPMAPMLLQIGLRNLRMSATKTHPTDALKRFLEETVDVPGEAIVVIHDDEFALLTNAKGEFLRFA